MPEKIHYDDNLFFLAALIRAIDDAVNLKVDADFFAKKILEDTFFIDLTLQKIHRSLKSNTHLIRRDHYLHTLMRVKHAFVNLIKDILALQGDFSVPFQTVTTKLRALATAHSEDVRQILDNLQSEKSSSNIQEIISSDELHFLMQPIEELPEVQI